MAQAQISGVRSPGRLLANIATQLADALRDRYGIQRELDRGGMANVYDRMRHEPQLTPDA